MRNRVITVFTNDPNGAFQSDVLRGIAEIAQESSHSLEVITFDKNRDEPPSVRGLSAVCVIANALHDDLIRDLYHSSVPLSLVAHRVPDLPAPVVMSNNAQGIDTLMRYLVEQRGRRRCLFIRGRDDQIDGQERMRAYRHALLRCGLPILPETFLDGAFDVSTAAQSMQAYLEQSTDFDAVLSADYLMALAVWKVLREAGIAVPDQVALVGYGDGSDAEAAGLTTCAADVVDLGRCAARQVFMQIRGARISGVTSVNTRLIIRQT